MSGLYIFILFPRIGFSILLNKKSSSLKSFRDDLVKLGNIGFNSFEITLKPFIAEEAT